MPHFIFAAFDSLIMSSVISTCRSAERLATLLNSAGSMPGFKITRFAFIISMLPENVRGKNHAIRSVFSGWAFFAASRAFMSKSFVSYKDISAYKSSSRVVPKSNLFLRRISRRDS